MKVACVVLTACSMVVAASALTIPAAKAQQGGSAGADSAQFEKGRALYDANCVACHQASGAGTPPAFPALAGNDKLKDLDLIVQVVHQGRGAMLAFPQLSADEIAAVASYVRNAWGNKFGVASADQVTTLLAALGKPADQKVSIWSGVYTKAQDERGEAIHSGACAHCHGPRLNGAAQSDQPPSPAIARVGFLRKWSGQSVAALFTYVCTKMPPDRPGTLSEQDCADAVAHMLAVSNIPAGDKELPADSKALAGIVIQEKK
jgi:mono/diheme cytochrome c family protein